MLTRIELTNFMSHAQTVIEPAPGLTVLTGPNNCGKSAVVTALQILCHNDNSTYVLRHEEKECAVRVETDDGHVVEWRRKTSPSYTIDGKLFDRLKTAGIPQELHDTLKLRKEGGDNDADFDVHFGTQKQPIFLLDSSPANAARFFASSSDASRLMEMQKRHKDKVANANRELTRLEAESLELNNELERLSPITELDTRLGEVEQQYQQLNLQRELLARGAQHESLLRAQVAAVEIHRARVAALQGLPAPPELAADEPLKTLIQSLVASTLSHANATARHAALDPLPTPPTVEDAATLAALAKRLGLARRTVAVARGLEQALSAVEQPPPLGNEDDLARLVVQMTAATLQQAQLEQRVAALQLVFPLEPLADLSPLAEFMERFQSVSKDIWRCETALETTGEKLAAAEAALREQAAEKSCAVCGAPLDPERVVARAAGMGGHEHGE